MSGMYITQDYATLADAPAFGTPDHPGSPFRLERIVVRPVAYRRETWWKVWTPRKVVTRFTAEFTLPEPIDWRKDIRRRWAAYKAR